ncbi:MAG TPA: hypothetical protein V6C78_22585 [Crinalium sp.]
MHITEQTPTRLTLTDHNRQWLWGTLFGLPFMMVGLGIAVVAGNLTKLECRRTPSHQITCQRTITGLLGTKTDAILGRVIRAGVVTDHGTGVVLSTSAGQIELVNHREFVGERQIRIAADINAFINDSQQMQLRVQQDDRLEEVANGAVFFLPGIAVILAALSIPMQVFCQLDKTTGQMTLKRRYRVWGTRTATYKLTDIQQAQIVQSPGSSRHPVYVVQVELKAAKPTALSPPTRDRQQCQTIVNAIHTFQ